MATERTMTTLVSGMAIRFVIRKYFGNVPNRSQTRGAVNIWQEMDRLAAFQTFLKGSSLPRIPPASG